MLPTNVFFKVFQSNYPSFTSKLNQSCGELKEEFLNAAHSFYAAAFWEMKKRLPNSTALVFQMNAFRLSDDDDFARIRLLGERFKHLLDDYTCFENEVVRAQNHKQAISGSVAQDGLNCMLSWKKLASGYPGYEQIYRLLRCLETLAYTSAPVERVFSKMGNIKTLKRNRLSRQHLESTLLIKQFEISLENYLSIPLLKKYNTYSETEHLSTQDSDRDRALLFTEEEEKKRELDLNLSDTSKDLAEDDKTDRRKHRILFNLSSKKAPKLRNDEDDDQKFRESE